MAKERQSDSAVHHEERYAKMQQESAAQQQVDAEAEADRKRTMDERERKMREAENQEIAKQIELVKGSDTREMLLEQIRKQREESPKVEVEAPVYRSEGLQKQFDAEQEEGRKRVAMAEAERERYRELQHKYEEEERKRLGEMVPVYHPNPGQDEQYPADKSTLGKRK